MQQGDYKLYISFKKPYMFVRRVSILKSLKYKEIQAPIHNFRKYQSVAGNSTVLLYLPFYIFYNFYASKYLNS